MSSTGFHDCKIGRHGLTDGLDVVVVGLLVALAQTAFQEDGSDLVVEAVLCHLVSRGDLLLEVLAEACLLAGGHGRTSILEVALVGLAMLLGFLREVVLAGRRLPFGAGSCVRCSLTDLLNTVSVAGEAVDVLVQLGAALGFRLGDIVGG